MLTFYQFIIVCTLVVFYKKIQNSNEFVLRVFFLTQKLAHRVLLEGNAVDRENQVTNTESAS